jgi:hypothetical protein
MCRGSGCAALSGRETQLKIIDPPTARLGPGENRALQDLVRPSDEAATGVLVTFAR